jgi:flagellar FliL protein
MSDAADTPDAPPKKKGKKMLVVALAAVLLLAGGGAAAWYFLKPRSEQDEAVAAAKAEEKRRALRVFATLENFVVNLADRDTERYAQIGVVLEMEDKDAEAKLTAKMPAVRNQILLLVSSKLANQLTTREGKEALAAEIALAAAKPLGWTPPSPEAEVEQEEEDPPPKVKTKDGDKAKKKEKDKPKPKKAEPAPNPVAQVHFSSFLVQ